MSGVECKDRPKLQVSESEPLCGILVGYCYQNLWESIRCQLYQILNVVLTIQNQHSYRSMTNVSCWPYTGTKLKNWDAVTLLTNRHSKRTEHRPVGSKFEMVRRYYSAKRAHNVPGHAHLPSPPHAARYPSSRMLILLSNCLLGRFEAVVTGS